MGGNRCPDGIAATDVERFYDRAAECAWIEPASVAVMIGTFASVVTLTTAMWLIQSGQLTFP